jgi:hypothetical protein
MTSRYKGRSALRRSPAYTRVWLRSYGLPGGLGRCLDDMHQFDGQRGIKDQFLSRRRDDEHDYLRWCFADVATAEAFATEFSGIGWASGAEIMSMLGALDRLCMR